MDRGAWWATIHRVAQSQTRLKQLSTHSTSYWIIFANHRLKLCFLLLSPKVQIPLILRRSTSHFLKCVFKIFKIWTQTSLSFACYQYSPNTLLSTVWEKRTSYYSPSMLYFFLPYSWLCLFWSILFVNSACTQPLNHAWLCDPMAYSLPGSSVHGIYQTRILQCTTFPFFVSSFY